VSKAPRVTEDVAAPPMVSAARAMTGGERSGAGGAALGDSIRIDWLGAHPGHARTLAEWHVRAFAEWVDGWQIDDAARELASHTRVRGVPGTLVALRANAAPLGEASTAAALLGSVSLLDSDAPAHVRADVQTGQPRRIAIRRRRGIGKRLVHAAVDEARRLGIARLHLWTPDQAGFYARLGWQSLGLHRFGGIRVSLMRFDCTAPA
jgi:GNAT superfamily N-acetyltransferase